ncbi:uncharacterized protein B0H18DRAFT_1037942 [Fomitopsis serialis]|uniref:uncharacterized protein n=1 Tax=Fomitopsis serialis TaxID=139415 RepID=UPI0020082AE3|nr:uncharacterized protein B0H18DRAFT_1037942 [Neoantrodia serialis]KAH9916654.1 hypothetical protein B0H18DRAFT_1037942 [Neoantrodia serialis]
MMGLAIILVCRNVLLFMCFPLSCEKRFKRFSDLLCICALSATYSSALCTSAKLRHGWAPRIAYIERDCGKRGLRTATSHVAVDPCHNYDC